jgi:hypothetical protein
MVKIVIASDSAVTPSACLMGMHSDEIASSFARPGLLTPRNDNGIELIPVVIHIQVVIIRFKVEQAVEHI